jgi:hypothetical protein
MIVKAPIFKQRVRQIPKSFSWVDHRLVRDHYIELCSHAEATLYLFLMCVADNKGLSYYGDNAIMKKLSMDLETLQAARAGLMKNNLIAWRTPIYQVLCLEPVMNDDHRSGSGMSLKDILQAAMEVKND